MKVRASGMLFVAGLTHRALQISPVRLVHSDSLADCGLSPVKSLPVAGGGLLESRFQGILRREELDFRREGNYAGRPYV